MEKELKVSVVVVNKPGGAMTVGGYATASAKPDGYTIGHLLNPTMVPEVYTYFQSAPYTSADLKPICIAQSFFMGSWSGETRPGTASRSSSNTRARTRA